MEDARASEMEETLSPKSIISLLTVCPEIWEKTQTFLKLNV